MYLTSGALFLWGVLSTLVAEQPWLLFPREESRAFSFESDAPAFGRFQARVPLGDSEVPLQVGKEQGFNGNAQCDFDRFLREAELSPRTSRLEKSEIVAFDEQSLTAVVFDQTFKLFAFNSTLVDFEEKTFDNLSQSLFSNFGNSTDGKGCFIIRAVPSETGSPELAVLVFNATVFVLDFRLGKVRLTFQADRAVSRSFPVKLTRISDAGEFVFAFLDAKAHQISVFLVNLSEHQPPVLNTFISLGTLTEPAAANNSTRPESSGRASVTDFAIVAASGKDRARPVFLVLTSGSGLYKFSDAQGKGDYQLDPFETQFIFGRSLSVVDDFAFVLQDQPETNSTAVEVYQIDGRKPSLLK